MTVLSSNTNSAPAMAKERNLEREKDKTQAKSTGQIVWNK